MHVFRDIYMHNIIPTSKKVPDRCFITVKPTDQTLFKSLHLKNMEIFFKINPELESDK